MKNKTIKKALNLLVIILMIFALVELFHVVQHHKQMDEVHEFIHQQMIICGQEMDADGEFICD